MNIETVANNLRNTIAGKEKMLEAMHPNNPFQTEYMDDGEVMARRVTIEFLKINIGELKRILQDVEQCAKQAADDSWMINPDRMGGGGYSAEELDPNRGWK